ncbi:MAG: hypothetical protein ABWX59_10205 [Microbacteriaceae bacterium]
MDSHTKPHRPPSPWWSKAALVLAGVVIAVSFVSLLGLALSGFYFDPDDFPSEYYRAQAVHHRQDMLVALLLPVAALVLAGIAGFSAGRAGARRVGAYWVGGLAVLVALAMLFVGTGNIHAALYFADYFASADARILW